MHRRLAFTLLLMSLTGLVRAEALRVLIPEFTGPEVVGRYVTATLFLNLSKSFAAHQDAEKGAWMLYGEHPLQELTHHAATEDAMWPHARADLVLWGSATPYGDGVVIQSHLTVTPVSKQRQERPEVWSVRVPQANADAQTVELDLPSLAYHFEPFPLPEQLLSTYTSEEGVPVYASPSGTDVLDHVSKAFRVIGYVEGGMQVRPHGGEAGWIRLPDLPAEGTQAVVFTRGIIRYLRGDWLGAQRRFDEVLESSHTPQSLRRDTLILRGITFERRGRSGLTDFQAAYAHNRLDRVAASYLLMGWLGEIERANGDTDAVSSAAGNLHDRLRDVAPLYRPDDAWFQTVTRLADRLP